MGIVVKGKHKQPVMRATITRADGRVEELGVISGGHWWQRLFSWVRIKQANKRTRIREKEARHESKRSS